MTEQQFDIKLASGKVVSWLGTTGEDACRRYADCKPGDPPVAWRKPRYEFIPGVHPSQIIG